MARGSHSKKKSAWRMALFFAWRNLKQQKGRTMIYAGMFLVLAVTAFLFIGELLVYADDRITKEYDSSAYLQQNDKRLVVRHYDNREVTKKDAAVIRKVKYVEQTDLYDYANDVNYYIEENRDYKKVFGDQQKKTSKEPLENKETVKYEEVEGIRFLNKTHFMKSTTCLTEEDLRAGRLPKRRNEIVLYAEDTGMLEKEKLCYFTSENIWEPEESCSQTLKIVGLLKEETEQVYFSPALCQMLTVGVDGYVYSMEYCLDQWTQKYHYSRQFYPLIADDLEGNHVRISSNYNLQETDPKDGTLNQLTLETAFLGHSLPIYRVKSGLKINVLEENGEFLENRENEYMGWEYEEEETDPAYTDGDEGNVAVDMEMCDQGANFIEVSQELFDWLYPEKTTQMSVYISDYSKTDQVIQALQKLNYDAISTYRVSATNYVQSKVYKRLEVLGISSVVLLFLAVLEILLLRSLLRQRKKEYELLQFMGMRVNQIKRIGYWELGIPCFTMAVLVLLGFLVGRPDGIPQLARILQYETVGGGLLYFAYNAIVMCLAVFFFHRAQIKERR